MKFSVTLFIASIGTASAFLAPSTKQRCMSLLARENETSEDTWGGVAMEVKNLSPSTTQIYDSAPATPQSLEPRMSESIPFMTCPAVLDGSMAGDVGFDPLGLAKSPQDLIIYREAEIKHARLAMLAAAGWPVSELFDKSIANVFGMDPILDATNRAPSVLNGGMGKISPLYWGVCVAIAAAVDMYGLSRASVDGKYGESKKKGYIPGDLGFDLFGLYPKDERGQKRMQTAEIKNGRLAMIAITAFAAQEFVAEIAVVDQTPFFFKPFTEVLADYDQTPFFFKPITEFLTSQANEGYYTPPVETPAYVEAVVSPIDAAVTTSVETTAAFTSSVDAVSTASVEATAVAPPADTVSTSVEAISPVSTPVNNAELLAAKKRIAELEATLATIGQ